MNVITSAQLQHVAPLCMNPAEWAAQLNNAMLLYGIANDANEMAEFLTQCAHESLQFTRLEENLSYSADRLMQVWPARFPTLASAEPYARAPHQLANFVYGGRMGNTAPADGWNYRGGGIIMITGKANYAAVGKAIGDPTLVLCPERLRTRATATVAAAAWWNDHPKLRELSKDLSNDDDYADFVSITRIVNGSGNGLADRARFRASFRSVLGLPA